MKNKEEDEEEEGRKIIESVEERRKSIESFTSEMLFIAGGGRLGVDGARRNEFPVQNLVVQWAKNGRAISTGRSVEGQEEE